MCVDKDTEFFNGNEWKKISDYQDGDMVLQYTEDGKTELVRPNAYIKLPCDTMYFIGNNEINQMLSDDHNMIFDDHNKLLEMKTSNFVESFNNDTFDTNRLKFRTTFYYDGKGFDFTDNGIRYLCEMIYFGMYKLIPKYWYKYSHHQLQVFCDSFLWLNGCCEDYRIKYFYTTNKYYADFIQFVFSSCGYKVIIDLHNNEYVITITKETLVRLNKEIEIKKVVTVDGYKYCFNVPSHM